MDPLTAAGIGLSITSLALQAFAGCIKAYQLFSDAQDMPSAYQHLRVRLRIEQSRLLNWGQKIGLVEELLDTPSRTLLQNRNLIIDVLLEMQALFRSCIEMEGQFDRLVPVKQQEPDELAKEESFERRFPRGTNTLLTKTLSFLEKAPASASARITWAMVKKDRFRALVEKLIDYNTTIEGMLDSRAIDDLQALQQQSYMALLQLNSEVRELKEISKAMAIKAQGAAREYGVPGGKDTTQGDRASQASVIRLADFKAQQMQLESLPRSAKLDPVEASEVEILTEDLERSEATFQGKRVWVDWKQYIFDPSPNSSWNSVIEDRVKRLAILLGSQNKPEQFGAPHCLGYFNDEDEDRYGLLYRKPDGVAPTTEPTSLRDLYSRAAKPSLTKRISLAHAIARCLMYLHSVNWLHKSFRSNNIIFFIPPDKALDYSSPTIAGFDYARPDLPDELTEPPPEHSNNDIYRRPSIVSRRMLSRSQKSHDIYSLGVVLVEIVFWQHIEEIMNIPNNPKAAQSKVGKVREMLLEQAFLQKIEADAGEIYSNVVRRCLTGDEELHLSGNVNETDGYVGARLQSVFSTEIVEKLRDMNL